METVTYTEARKNLVKTMEKVCDDHAPVVITRQKADPVVLLSLEDYHSLEENNLPGPFLSSGKKCGFSATKITCFKGDPVFATSKPISLCAKRVNAKRLYPGNVI